MLAISTAAYFFGSILVDFGLTQMLASKVLREDHLASLRLSYIKLRSVVMSILMVSLIFLLIFGAPELAIMIFLGLVVGGFSSIGEEWILLGRSEFGRMAAFQMIGRGSYLISLFILLPLIRDPWVPMVCLGVSNLISSSLSWLRAGVIKGASEGNHSVRTLIRTGAPAVGARLLTTGYGQSASVYYAAVVPVAGIGLFSAGDKLVRASSAALDAVAVALLPRMSALNTFNEFWNKAIRSTIVAFFLGILAATVLWMAAPLAITVLYGDSFVSAIPVLRSMTMLIPAVAVSSMIMTSVLYVRQDSAGILIGATIGLLAGGCGFGLTVVTGGSLDVMVAAVVSLEWVVASYYVSRLLVLKRRERIRRVRHRLEPMLKVGRNERPSTRR